jgi:hypothetical protein
MAKAIIDTEFICIKHAKENVIYSAAMIIVNKSGEEVFSKKWDVKYDLREYNIGSYIFGLRLANTPKYRPARGKLGIKYNSRKGKYLHFVQHEIRKLQKQYKVRYWYVKGPCQTDLLLLDKCKKQKLVYKIEGNPNCVKYQGKHDPLQEIKYYKQYLYNPKSVLYRARRNEIVFKRIKTYESKSKVIKKSKKLSQAKKL